MESNTHFPITDEPIPRKLLEYDSCINKFPILKRDGCRTTIDYQFSEEFHAFFDHPNTPPNPNNYEMYEEFYAAMKKWSYKSKLNLQNQILPNNLSGFIGRPRKAKFYRLNHNAKIDSEQIIQLHNLILNNSAITDDDLLVSKNARLNTKAKLYIRENRLSNIISLFPNPEFYDNISNFKSAIKLWYQENKDTPKTNSPTDIAKITNLQPVKGRMFTQKQNKKEFTENTFYTAIKNNQITRNTELLMQSLITAFQVLRRDQPDTNVFQLREDSTMPIFLEEIPEGTILSTHELSQICLLNHIPVSLYPNIVRTFLIFCQKKEPCDLAEVFQNTDTLEKAARVLSLYSSVRSPLFDLQLCATGKLNRKDENMALIFHAHRIFAQEFLLKSIKELCSKIKNFSFDAINMRILAAKEQREMFVECFSVKLVNLIASCISEITAPSIAVIIVLIFKLNCQNIIDLLPNPFFTAQQFCKISPSFFPTFVEYVRNSCEVFTFFRNAMFVPGFHMDLTEISEPVLGLMTTLSYGKSKPKMRCPIIDIRGIIKQMKTDLAAPLLQGACFSLIANFKHTDLHHTMLAELGHECMARLADESQDESKILLLIGLGNLTRAENSLQDLSRLESFANFIAVLQVPSPRVQTAAWEVVRSLMGAQMTEFARIVLEPPFVEAFKFALSRITRSAIIPFFRGINAAIIALVKPDTLGIGNRSTNVGFLFSLPNISREIIVLSGVMLDANFKIIEIVVEFCDRSLPTFNYYDHFFASQLRNTLMSHQAVRKVFLASKLIA